MLVIRRLQILAQLVSRQKQLRFKVEIGAIAVSGTGAAFFAFSLAIRPSYPLVP